MKNKISAVLIAVALFLALCPDAFPKRLPPPEVKPLVHKGVEYRAEHRHMGAVEAWDKKTNKMLWRCQIYVVTYDLNLEKDVQDVFIISLLIENGFLIIMNESGHRYRLDLSTLEVIRTD